MLSPAGPDDDIPYNVQFEDDEEDWFKADQVVSAGTEAAEALAEAAEAQQEAEQEIRPNRVDGSAVEQYDEIVLVEQIELVVVGRWK